MRGSRSAAPLYLYLLGAGQLHAQYTVTRVATVINGPSGMAADASGNVYLAEAGAPFTIREINPAGVMAIVAGAGILATRE